jgi:hypothetical protein
VTGALQKLDLAVFETLLAPAEVKAMRARTAALLRAGEFPDPPEDRRPYPWPHI